MAARSKPTESRRQERLLREAVRAYLASGLAEAHPTSRLRELRFSSELQRPRLNLSEDYVTRVLGFHRGALTESVSNPRLERDILQAHFLFESWWSKAISKAKDIAKDNPISRAADAVKAAGSGVKGVAVALGGIVASGGDAIATVLAGAKNLMSKGLDAVRKALGKVSARLRQVADKLKTASIKSALGKAADVIEGIVNKVVDGVKDAVGDAGWKGMMAGIACYLAVAATRAKITTFAEALLKILSGKAAEMLKGALELKKTIGDLVPESEDEGKSAEEEIEDAGEAKDAAAEDAEEGDYLKAAAAAAGALKGFVWGLLKKAVGAAGIGAVEQLAGPVAWVKKLAELFEKVGGGIAWVSERIMEAISRAQFKPASSQPAA